MLINELVASVAEAGKCVESCDVAPINESEDGICLSVNGFLYRFLQIYSGDSPSDNYLVVPVMHKNLEALPGIKVQVLMDQLETVDKSLGEIVKFSTGDYLGGRLQEKFQDATYYSGCVIPFKLAGKNLAGAVAKVYYNTKEMKFVWGCSYFLRDEQRNNEHDDFESFIGDVRQVLILKPLGKARMEDVTPEDGQVLKMINYG